MNDRRYLVEDEWFGPRSPTDEDERRYQEWRRRQDSTDGHFHTVKPPRWLCRDCGCSVWDREAHDRFHDQGGGA